MIDIEKANGVRDQIMNRFGPLLQNCVLNLTASNGYVLEVQLKDGVRPPNELAVSRIDGVELMLYASWS